MGVEFVRLRPDPRYGNNMVAVVGTATQLAKPHIGNSVSWVLLALAMFSFEGLNTTYSGTQRYNPRDFPHPTTIYGMWDETHIGKNNREPPSASLATASISLDTVENRVGSSSRVGVRKGTESGEPLGGSVPEVSPRGQS